jgi:methenyltetrahydrofolate cyclohydrolase
VNESPAEEQPFAELLALLADRTPAPGGGSAAAWGLALAASLLQMACSFTLAREQYRERHERMRAIAARAGELRAEALALATEDLRSYEGVLAAMRRPPDDGERKDALLRAQSAAADVPLRTATAAAEVAELATEVAITGNVNLIGDASAAALLAEAACSSAATLVRINLADAPADPRRAEADLLVARAVAASSRLPA